MSALVALIVLHACRLSIRLYLNMYIGVTPNLHFDKDLVLHHYKLKSEEEWNKIIFRRNKTGMNSRDATYPWKSRTYFESHCNKMSNTNAQRFSGLIRNFDLTSAKKSFLNGKFYLTVVAIFKDEDDYIEEWLKYYILNGVSHFFLYNNGPAEPTTTLIRPFIDKGFVTLIPWPTLKDQNSTQYKAYEDFQHNYMQMCNWIIKVDLDEILVPSASYPSIQSLLKSKYDLKTVKGVMFPRINFGSNGHKRKPLGLVIDEYTLTESTWSHFKSIGNSRFINKNGRGHFHNFHYTSAAQ